MSRQVKIVRSQTEDQDESTALDKKFASHMEKLRPLEKVEMVYAILNRKYDPEYSREEQKDWCTQFYDALQMQKVERLITKHFPSSTWYDMAWNMFEEDPKIPDQLKGVPLESLLMWANTFINAQHENRDSVNNYDGFPSETREEEEDEEEEETEEDEEKEEEKEEDDLDTLVRKVAQHMKLTERTVRKRLFEKSPKKPSKSTSPRRSSK